MKTVRLFLFVTLCGLLSSCFQLQILGSVSGASFTVTPLRDPTTVLYSGTSWDEAAWLRAVSQEDWDSWNGFLQLLLLGIFYPDNGNLDPEALYLITASGGVDEDSNLDSLRDSTGAPVGASWHAIVTGAQIERGGFKVTTLSDAIYRGLRPELAGMSDAQVLARLQLAAERTVTDSNKDGVLNYRDVLFWSRIFEGALYYRHDLDWLDALGAAIIAGAPEADLSPLAEAAVSGYDANYWRLLVAEIDSAAFTTDQFLYATLPDKALCIPGALTNQAQERARHTLNKTRELHVLGPVTHSPTYDPDTQASALIQSANGSFYLSHFPAMSDACYTEIGADASATGNLGNGSQTSDPAENIIGWTDDSSNVGNLAGAGHRRWNLDPFMLYTSYGQVGAASSLKVFDFDREAGMAPQITVDYVAFPYRYYPFPFISTNPSRPTPWSFSVVEDKGSTFGNQHPYFTNARVTVTRDSDGASLGVHSQHTDTNGAGVPNFLSWQVNDWRQDTLYQITISNVTMQSGQMRSFSYPVFIDYANLIDLSEPLEAGDSVSGTNITGSLADDVDQDSYSVELAGPVTVNASSQFNVWGFYVLVYGPDKQLLGASDESFSLNLEPGTYTIVAANCHDLSCWQGSKNYTISFD